MAVEEEWGDTSNDDENTGTQMHHARRTRLPGIPDRVMSQATVDYIRGNTENKTRRQASAMEPVSRNAPSHSLCISFSLPFSLFLFHAARRRDQQLQNSKARWLARTRGDQLL